MDTRAESIHVQNQHTCRMDARAESTHVQNQYKCIINTRAESIHVQNRYTCRNDTRTESICVQNQYMRAESIHVRRINTRVESINVQNQYATKRAAGYTLRISIIYGGPVNVSVHWATWQCTSLAPDTARHSSAQTLTRTLNQQAHKSVNWLVRGNVQLLYNCCTTARKLALLRHASQPTCCAKPPEACLLAHFPRSLANFSSALESPRALRAASLCRWLSSCCATQV